MDSEASRPAGKASRPRAGKPSRPREPVAGSRVKATLHLDVEASRRLDVHCAMTGMTRSALVEQLIVEHLRRFVVSDRGVPSSSPAPVRLAEPGDAA